MEWLQNMGTGIRYFPGWSAILRVSSLFLEVDLKSFSKQVHAGEQTCVPGIGFGFEVAEEPVAVSNRNQPRRLRSRGWQARS